MLCRSSFPLLSTSCSVRSNQEVASAIYLSAIQSTTVVLYIGVGIKRAKFYVQPLKRVLSNSPLNLNPLILLRVRIRLLMLPNHAYIPSLRLLDLRP